MRLPPQPTFVRPIGEGIELALKVVPGASRSEIAGTLGDRLKVRVAAPAEKGRANRAVVALLREWLGVRQVEIVAGHASADKTARVEGLAGLDERQLARLARAGVAVPTS